MSDTSKYAIHLEPKFDFLQLIDVPALIEACEGDWYNQTLCRVNESVIRLGVMQGEFHWHRHDKEDEFFFVLEGMFHIDLEDQTIVLSRHQGYTIPRSVVHRTRSPERSAILMVEQSSITPTGDD